MRLQGERRRDGEKWEQGKAARAFETSIAQARKKKQQHRAKQIELIMMMKIKKNIKEYKSEEIVDRESRLKVVVNLMI